MKQIIYAFLIVALASCGHKAVDNARIADEFPPIFPDYVGVTVPQNIAPLNFCVDSVDLLDVVITGAKGGEIHTQHKQCSSIPIDEWHRLLAQNVGDSISVTVSCLKGAGWVTYRPFGIHVSPDSIDYGLTYRLIAPGYEVYSKMGIYERSLADFSEKPIMENTQIDGCLNCHSYNQCNPEHFGMHVRGPHGATLLRVKGNMDVYETKTDSSIAACVYPYWHPSGRYIAYSTNDTRQVVHTAERKRIEVIDLDSDLQIYDTSTGHLLLPSSVRQDSVWETFPAFSPDGKSIYFCAARAVEMPEQIRQARYDLCRADFDAESGSVGERIDTLVCASARGKSVSFPRPSFDGKYLMYTLSDYGNFSIWHPEADLWMLDLATGETFPLDAANSDETESYHNFSSNSRWAVFGSRRGGGLFTRAYICHIGPDGRASKPFLLPQENPREYYDAQFFSYNIPEFVTAPVNLDRNAAESLLTSPKRTRFIPQ